MLGRTKSGTLVLSEDDTGCARADPPNTQLGNDVLELVERGISGMSFGFRALKEGGILRKSPYLRTVTAAELGNHRYLCLLILNLAWKSHRSLFPNILNCAALAITVAAGLN
jgi:hypothetical protein